MDLNNLKAAIAVADHNMLDDIFHSLLGNMWPNNSNPEFDEQCELLEEKGYWRYDLQFQTTSALEVYLDVYSHEGKPLRKYHLNYIPKWVKPLAQRAKWDEEKASFSISCNTFYENLDGSLND